MRARSGVRTGDRPWSWPLWPIVGGAGAGCADWLSRLKALHLGFLANAQARQPDIRAAEEKLSPAPETRYRAGQRPESSRNCACWTASVFSSRPAPVQLEAAGSLDAPSPPSAEHQRGASLLNNRYVCSIGDADRSI